MKKTGYLFLAVLMACSKAEPPASPEAATILEVVAATADGQPIDGASVFVDGDSVGQTPLEYSPARTGLMPIRVSKTGYALFVDQIPLRRGEMHSVEAILSALPPNEGQLLVTTNIDTALFEIRNSMNSVVGQKRCREMSRVLPAGGYFVSASRDGYTAQVLAVLINGGQATSVNLALQRHSGPQPTLDFSVLQDTVRENERIDLRWASDGYQVVIDQGIGVRGPSGAEKVSPGPPGLHVYSATAYSRDNTTRQVVDSVYVLAAQQRPPYLPQPTLEFSVLQDTVRENERIDLHWLTDGFQVVFDQGIGVRGPSGAEKVSPGPPGLNVFSATAYSRDNATRQVIDSVFVLAAEQHPPSLQLAFQQDTVIYGERAALRWQSDASRVIIDNGVGERGPAGSEDLLFAQPGRKRVTATAYAANGLMTTVSDSIYVREADLPPLPVLMLSVTRSVAVDAAAVISWYSQNADFVAVDYVQEAAKQGRRAVRFGMPGQYVVKALAYNQAGWVTVQDTIDVVAAPSESVEDILLPAGSVVVADKGREGSVDVEAARFTVLRSGTYKVMAEVWYNSGDAQRNESFFLQIREEGGVLHAPRDANAGVYKVVADAPGEPNTVSRESGLFALSPGTYAIELHHYAEIAAAYPQFLNGSMSGPESVKIVGFRLVYAGR